MKFLKVCGMDTWNLKRVAKWVILYHARYDGFKLNNDCWQPLFVLCSAIAIKMTQLGCLEVKIEKM